MARWTGLGRTRRRALLRAPWQSPVVALHCGAARLQAVARGWLSRAPSQPAAPPRRLVAGGGQLARYAAARGRGAAGAGAGFAEWCAARVQAAMRGRARPRQRLRGALLDQSRSSRIVSTAWQARRARAWHCGVPWRTRSPCPASKLAKGGALFTDSYRSNQLHIERQGGRKYKANNVDRSQRGRRRRRQRATPAYDSRTTRP